MQEPANGRNFHILSLPSINPCLEEDEEATYIVVFFVFSSVLSGVCLRGSAYLTFPVLLSAFTLVSWFSVTPNRIG